MLRPVYYLKGLSKRKLDTNHPENKISKLNIAHENVHPLTITLLKHFSAFSLNEKEFHMEH